MTRTIHKTEQPVVLEGFQAVMKPSKFGYSLSTIVSESMVDALEADRVEYAGSVVTLMYIDTAPAACIVA